MTTYYSTFITGFQEIVSNSLKEKLKNAQIDLMLDGVVVYKSNEPIEKILGIRFLNNTYVLLRITAYSRMISIKSLIRDFLQNSNKTYPFSHSVLNNKKYFRVIASDENQIVAIDKNLLGKLEKILVKKLQLKVDRAKPDTEVWFLKRREGYGFVGLRLTQTPNYEKILHKGELRPEMAHIMCLLAEVQKEDVVLDPFAGYGSIPVECVKNFQVKEVIVGEKDKEMFKILRIKLNKTRSKTSVWRMDALNLVSLADKSVNKIITDPPWGFYDNKNANLKEFYTKMLIEFIRILKPNGLIIILMGQKELFSEIINNFQQLHLLKKYDTLISGKKAAVFKIKSEG